MKIRIVVYKYLRKLMSSQEERQRNKSRGPRANSEQLLILGKKTKKRDRKHTGLHLVVQNSFLFIQFSLGLLMGSNFGVTAHSLNQKSFFSSMTTVLIKGDKTGRTYSFQGEVN